MVPGDINVKDFIILYINICGLWFYWNRCVKYYPVEINNNVFNDQSVKVKEISLSVELKASELLGTVFRKLHFSWVTSF